LEQGRIEGPMNVLKMILRKIKNKLVYKIQTSDNKNFNFKTTVSLVDFYFQKKRINRQLFFPFYLVSTTQNSGQYIWTNMKIMKGCEKKTDWLGNLRPKEQGRGEFSGFSLYFTGPRLGVKATSNDSGHRENHF
jgi:hypothetical protein